MFSFGSVAVGGEVWINGVRVGGGAPAKKVDREANGETLRVNYATIRGHNNKIYGNYNKIVGNSNSITGNYNKITGDDSVVEGNYNEIVGHRTNVKGNYNDPIKGDDCVASGNHNDLTGARCKATGNYCTINGEDVERPGSSRGSGGGFSFSSGAGSSVFDGDIVVGSGQSMVIRDGQTWINGVLLVSDQERRRQIEAQVREELKVPAVSAPAPKPARLKIPSGFKSEKIPDGNKDEGCVCKICYDALISTVVVDCGHSYMCPDCARQEPDKCAICKKDIKAGITVLCRA